MKLHATIVCFILGLVSLRAADAPGPLALVLQSLVDKRIAPGVVVLVADKEKVLVLEKAGYASLANKTPMHDDAVFWIASMSKSLTGAALMMLVDEGKVSLDDPVEKYLPEFKGQMVALAPRAWLLTESMDWLPSSWCSTSDFREMAARARTPSSRQRRRHSHNLSANKQK